MSEDVIRAVELALENIRILRLGRRDSILRVRAALEAVEDAATGKERTQSEPLPNPDSNDGASTCPPTSLKPSP